MAEHNFIRRVGGDMEPRRGLASRRILLPSEVELCNVLGLSEEEYWFFVDKTASYNGQRSEAYDLVPDIQATGLEAWAIQLIVGVVFTVVSYLMTPKPKEPKTPPSFRTADKTGQKRFSPQSGFDSVQELAELGETIPLIFTRREGNHGGIRVSTKLIWSQMLSHWSGQQLRGLFLICQSELESNPDFAGYAIGDTTLANYMNAKLAIYGKIQGGRIKDVDKYPEGSLSTTNTPIDVFSVYSDYLVDYSPDIVSGTRTPSSQSEFGAFAPMPNGMRFMVPYELILKGDDASKQTKKDINKKRKKVETYFPRYAGTTYVYTKGGGTASRPDFGSLSITEGDKVGYLVQGVDPAKEENFDTEFNPWGMDDVKSSIDSERITIDNNLAIGDSYLIGTALGVCRTIHYTKGSNIWVPDAGIDIEAKFEVTEGLGTITAPGLTFDEEGNEVRMSRQTFGPSDVYIIQRAALGTVSNNTKCDTTEIGIKSTVWKQITGFPNVNSHPGHVRYGEGGTVRNYEKDNGSISLGQISKYITRYSFFRLQGRIAGAYPMEEWKYIDGGIPFAVKGNTPQPQYNFIRINHSSSYQYEFRFVPYPGNRIKSKLSPTSLVSIRLFQKDALSGIENSNDIFDVYYSGKLSYLAGNSASNPEWYLGDIPEADLDQSRVVGFGQNHNGPGIPTVKGWAHVATRKFKEEEGDGLSNLPSDPFTGAPNPNYKPDPIINGVTWKYDNTWSKGTSIKTNFYWSGELKGTLNVYKRSSRTSYGVIFNVGASGLPAETDLQWPEGYVGISDNEIYSVVGEDGKQYRIGGVVSKTDYKAPEEAHIAQYEWGYVEEEHKESYKDIATTAVSGSGSGLTLEVRIYKGDKRIIGWFVMDGGSGYQTGDEVEFTMPDRPEEVVRTMVLAVSGTLVEDQPWPVGNNLNPYDAISDHVLFDAERSSHLDGPEHQIVYVNEQHKASNLPINYPELSYVGLCLNSSKEWTSFSQFSAYIKKGIKIERLVKDKVDVTILGREVSLIPTEASNLFPEIAYALLTDTRLGAGKLIGVNSVDRERMEIAAKFCEANKFYWDGAITEPQNLREFIFQMAGYCLLDFTILGGKFSLIPSVPYKTDYTIDRSAIFGGTGNLRIKALFTDGNIKNLKVSFLHPEERQLFKGRAVYRSETENGFPETKVVDLRLSTEGSDEDPVETFDMSSFCTSSEHALAFLRYALRVRERVDHGIVFETAPQFAMSLAPGDYFRLYSESTHTSRFENGSISSDGTVQSIGKSVITDEAIYYWNSDLEEVKETTLTVVDGRTDKAELFNSVFTIKKQNRSDRVYKVESLTYSEDGLIKIAGSHTPLTDIGSLAILEWTESDFV